MFHLLVKISVLTLSAGILWLPGCDGNSTRSHKDDLAVNSLSASPSGSLPDSKPLGKSSGDTEIRFEDSSEEAKFSNIISTGFSRKLFGLVEIFGAGVAMVDFDCDGLQDLWFAGGGTFLEDKSVRGLTGELYRGTGGMTMLPVGRKSGFDVSRYYSHSVLVADIDSDGFPDCVVTGYRGLQCFINQGDGTFQEVADHSGLNDDRWSTCGALADFNNDGNLDIFVTRYADLIVGEGPVCALASDPSIPASCSPAYFPGVKDSFYLSEGDGSFKDFTEAAGIVDGGRGLGAIAADLDGDGNVDIYVANDTERNHLYRNDGHAVFSEIGVRAGVALDSRGAVGGSMGVALGDSNNDSLLDLFVTNFEKELPALYRNRGKLLFRFDSLAAKIGMLGPSQSSWGTTFTDVDNDGDEDLIVISSHIEPTQPAYLQTPSLLENLGSGTFKDISSSVGDFFKQARPGRGLATGDIDGDGRVDFVSTNIDQPNTLLHNQTKSDNHYLSVRLIGTISNRDAIGSTVILVCGDQTWTRHRYGGGSYASTCDKTLHFGVPRGSVLPAKLIIRWHLGKETQYDIDRWDRHVDFVEPN